MATTILNVDDKEINRYIRTQVLEKAGYRVIEANGGARAIELCRAEKPELVLLDINMPDLNGLEVCRLIKTECGGDKPVIVVHISATATATDDLVRGLEGGADAYLSEPVEPLLLLATIRSMMRVHQAERAVRERDASLQRLVNSNIVGIVIADMNGVKEANAEFLRMIGGTPEDLKNGRVDWQKTTPPEHLASDFRALEELRTRGACTPFEKEYVRRDGSRIPILIGAAALSLEPLEWIAFATDLSAQKAAQAELEARTRQLAQSNEELQRFAYVLAHDLKSPLRTVAALTQLFALLRSRDADPEKLDDLITQILSAVSGMERLITELLEYSKVSSGNVQPLASVDSAALIASALANLNGEIKNSDASIVIGPLPKVVADEHLARVFQNLIANAIKYSGGKKPEVRISAERKAREWQFAVQDNGIGFEMKYAEKIFGVFQRLHGKNIEGTGLGLAICKKLIERYHGCIWAESTPGQGSTFYFTVAAAVECATA